MLVWHLNCLGMLMRCSKELRNRCWSLIMYCKEKIMKKSKLKSKYFVVIILTCLIFPTISSAHPPNERFRHGPPPPHSYRYDPPHRYRHHPPPHRHRYHPPPPLHRRRHHPPPPPHRHRHAPPPRERLLIPVPIPIPIPLPPFSHG